MAKSKTAENASTDWEHIQTLYRTGTRSVREIAAEVGGISHAGILKRAKKEGWTRDLSKKVCAAADAKVSRALVSTLVTAETKITEQVAVDVESTVVAHVRIGHRKDIGRARSLVMKLLAELEHQTDHADLYEKLFNLLHDDGKGDEKANERCRKLHETFQRALSLAGRVDTLKKLAETLRVLIDKEREAFGIVPPDGSEGAQTPFAVALREFIGSIQQQNLRLPMVAREPAVK